MTDSQQPEDYQLEYERSLRRLTRAIQLSEGRFSLNLVRCNYTELQTEIRQQLRERCSLTIQELILKPSDRKLYTAIKNKLGDTQPQALMVSGFETVTALDDLLVASNQVRDDFRKSFDFPLVLWINDEVLKKLMRLAPDFNSWAGVPIHFTYSTDNLLDLLKRETDIQFAEALEIGAGRFPRSSALYPGNKNHSHQPLQAALKELGDRGKTPTPYLQASLDFVLGQDAYAKEQMEPAREMYERSLHFWQQEVEERGVGYGVWGVEGEGRDREGGGDEGGGRNEGGGGDRGDTETRRRGDTGKRKGRKPKKLLCPKIAALYSKTQTSKYPLRKRYSPKTQNSKLKTLPHPSSLIPHPSSLTPNPLLTERLACVYFYLGLWWRRKSVLDRAQFAIACENARFYYKQCINGLQQGNRSDLAAKFINALGEVLQRQLHQNGLSVETKASIAAQLTAVATSAVELHKTYPDPIRLAYSYGLLAEVALAESTFNKAKQYAELALETNEQSPPLTLAATWQYVERCWARRHYRSLYRLLLAQAQAHVVSVQAAVKTLEIAREECNHAYDPLLYTRILEALRDRYFEQGDYLKAFETKREQRSIEQQYSLRAFIGAVRLQPERQVINPGLMPIESPDETEAEAERAIALSGTIAQEIAASGREKDVENLIRRLGEHRYRLTIIHGPSGVGKSSIINAGLVPALHENPIGDRRVLPLLLRVYTGNWIKTLGTDLAKSLRKLNESAIGLADSTEISPLVEQLKQNADRRRLLTVLILDQFEEFFFAYPKPSDRQSFYEFLRECLRLPYVKIVLSLREDFLHYLLELVHLDDTTTDILSCEHRYPLGNFEPHDAQLIIDRLTHRSQFHLATDLIQQLVDDLSAELGKVRPIELQIVGAQLQDQDITTKEHYKQLGLLPKEKLVEQFLERVIKDCGQENEETANLILYLLTDENGIRPIKTLPELIANLKELNLPALGNQIRLVLTILVGSGLVFEIPEIPTERYQLVHDYLASLVRQKCKPIVNHLTNAAENSRFRKTLLRQSYQLVASFAIALGTPLLALIGVTWYQENQGAVAKIEATISQAAEQFQSNKQLEALSNDVKAGTLLLKRLNRPDASFLDLDFVQAKTLGSLLEDVYSIQEKNVLIGHRLYVNRVAFSPQVNLFASASADNTVKLWNTKGENVKTLEGHTSRVNSVSFSPNGKQLASASDDRTIKLWDVTGKLLRTFRGHEFYVNSVAFSPDGQVLASASDDDTVKLWNCKNGQELRSFSGHRDRVKAVSFSPNGQQLASASWDGTVRLWNRDGVELRRFVTEGNSQLTSLSFSPDGNLIAAGSSDSTIKLWNIQGQLIQTLKGHAKSVNSVGFSPDGQKIVSASSDETVRVWRLNGDEQTLLKLPKVISASFVQDNQTIASTGEDNAVHLWSLETEQPDRLTHQAPHQTPITSISYSPDGQMIASSSKRLVLSANGMLNYQQMDGKIIVWNVERKQSIVFPAAGDFVKVKFSPDGQRLVTIEQFLERDRIRSKVKLWNLDGTAQKPELLVEGEATDFSFSPDGQVIAIAENIEEEAIPTTQPDVIDKKIAGTIKLWNITQNTLKTIAAHSDKINSISVSRNGAIATASSDLTVKLWNQKGTRLYTFNGHTSSVTSVSFSPSGNLIASASADTHIILWHINGDPPRTLTGHTKAVTSVNFSLDGKLLLSSGEDNTLRVWSSTETRSEATNPVATLQVNGNPSSNAIFSPNQANPAISVANDSAINLWQLNLAQLLRQSCQHLTNYLAINQNPDDDQLCQTH